MFHQGMNFWNRPFICTQRELRGSKLDAKTSRARSELTKYPPKPIILNPSFLISFFFNNHHHSHRHSEDLDYHPEVDGVGFTAIHASQ